MIKVSPRARRSEDRAGDPLDGLVNLFDIGIVLAVAFLLAALASLNLTEQLTRSGLTHPAKDVITVGPNDKVSNVPATTVRTIGRGNQVGTVYRLRDGRLVYVVSSPAASSPTTPAPSGSSSP